MFLDDVELNDDYVLEADSITSCAITLEDLEEGSTYFFGFPTYSINADVVTYLQCMSPFYEIKKIGKLANCINLQNTTNINIFPNPIQNSEFTISGQINNLHSMKLFNTSGQLMYSEEINNRDQTTFTLPNKIRTGIYFVLLESREGIRYHSKILI